MQTIDSIKTHVHGMRKDLICKKEKIKRINIRKQSKKKINLDVVKENIKDLIRIGQNP